MKAANATSPLQVTADSVDPKFNEPYIDVDELRTDPVPHRYVHGGFKGTDACFSFYFPPAEQYQKRFHHNTYPLALTSDVGPFPIQFDVAIGNIGFTLASGAYYVQTNLGGADRMPPAQPSVAAYRVNAEAAKFSRKVAADMYGPHRPYGYLYGGSGGSYQVMGASENTSGVWDGFLPYVLGSPYGIPSLWTARMHALRILRQRNKLAGIVDAINPGGSGDPYADLNEEEAAAFREVSLFGFPLRGWYPYETLNSGYFSGVAHSVPTFDSTYIDDFWSKPGYLGTDPKSSIRNQRFSFDTSIAKVIDGFANPVEGPPKYFELANVPDKDLADSHLVFLSGAAEGKSLPLRSIKGKVVAFVATVPVDLQKGIKAGDQVRIDNSWVLATQTYHRHQVPESLDLYGWNQFRHADGKPMYPQRAVLTGPIGAIYTVGSMPNGRISAKMLVLEALMDIDAIPWGADWYRGLVKRAMGDKFEDNFAIWFIDHAQHDNPQNLQAHAHAVSFAGALQQGLRDLSAWVEKGVKPSETRYKVVDTQVEVPATAQERKGIQAVVDVSVNGGVRADVAVNEPVTFTATIEVPPNAGKVVSAEWDFEGVGNYPTAAKIATPAGLVSISATYAYSKPGTYFPVLRAASQREGDAQTPYARVENIGRARVVVK